MIPCIVSLFILLMNQFFIVPIRSNATLLLKFKDPHALRTYFALTGANFNFRLEDVLAEKEKKKSFTRLFCILASK